MAKYCECRICKKRYIKLQPFQTWCSPDCAIVTLRLREKRKEDAAKRLFNKTTREMREKLKTPQEHSDEAKRAAQKYVRMRDQFDGCISCDKPSSWGGQWHGSHYRPAGTNSAVRFHPYNINKSCSECNNHKSGNLIIYRKNLVEKIGLQNVEWLESQNQIYRWDVDDLIEIKKYYNEQIKILEKHCQ